MGRLFLYLTSADYIITTNEELHDARKQKRIGFRDAHWVGASFYAIFSVEVFSCSRSGSVRYLGPFRKVPSGV